MTEEDYEEAHILKEKISLDIHAIVDVALSGKSTEVKDLIRELLNEQFRFY